MEEEFLDEGAGMIKGRAKISYYSYVEIKMTVGHFAGFPKLDEFI